MIIKMEFSKKLHMYKPLKCSSSFLLADVAGGLVFGIPLSQCIENDRIARIAAGEVTDVVGCLNRSSRHGSRTSFSSLIETPTTVAAKTEEVRNYQRWEWYSQYKLLLINKIYLIRLLSHIYLRSLYFSNFSCKFICILRVCFCIFKIKSILFSHLKKNYIFKGDIYVFKGDIYVLTVLLKPR